MIGQKFGILTVLDEKYNKENKKVLSFMQV